MEGKASIFPTPGFIFSTSISESSGLRNIRAYLGMFRKAYGKYKSVFPGKTSVFALMACMAALKSPLYGSCFEQSPACQVYNITSRFSGSKDH
jgi:hypothetical protein